jgi:hypothetical protein
MRGSLVTVFFSMPVIIRSPQAQAPASTFDLGYNARRPSPRGHDVSQTLSCPRCSSRRAKRHCPALETTICAVCCAEERLVKIPCPADCPHLKSEFYQLSRRKERAEASGRKLLQSLADLFWNAGKRELAFLIAADIYWWTALRSPESANPPPEDAALSQALVEARQKLIGGEPAEGPPGTLAEFLFQLAARGPKHTQTHSGPLTIERRAEVFESLARHIAKSGFPQNPAFFGQIASNVRELDFAADLDYVPSEELARREGGAA